jgi:2-amino-4-hydroxy-6-hydroxymethyldihydropteridine diphosphokinase
MALAYLGLGSNLGNRLAFMRGGRDAICSRSGVVLEASSGVYETEAQGGPQDSPDYLNAVLAVRTTLAPQELLDACRAVEDDFGRVRHGKWTPRTLDIDLLMYDAQIIAEEHLQVPHPCLHERRFVLVPFAEIAPETVHPLRLETIGRLADQCAGSGAVRLLRSTW